MATTTEPVRKLFVGGDWYEGLLLGSGKAAFVVGDVVGHGITAANKRDGAWSFQRGPGNEMIEDPTQKIGRPRQKLERRKIAFIERTGVGPNPANAILFQEANKLWPMPSGVTKFNRKAEIPRQLTKKIAQRQLAILRRERRRKLDQDGAKFCSKRFDGAEEQV